MLHYSLGLDIGISSVGWAVVDLDPNNRSIIDLGVRCFNVAEVAKTKEPLAKARREARGARRRIRRLSGRKANIKLLFVDFGLVNEKDIDNIYETAHGKASPWELRTKALDEVLTGEELARSLFHIARRRGFKSNRKNEEKSGDDGKVLEAVSTNRVYMEENGYRTAGEMLYKDDKYQEKKRNSNDNYINSIDRIMLLEEVEKIFKMQRKLGSSIAGEKLEEEYIAEFTEQKHYASGGYLEKIGYCTFEPTENRAARSSFSAAYFRLLQEINNIRYFEGSNEKKLEGDVRQAVIDKALSVGDFTYHQLRAFLKKEVGFSEETRFKNVQYNKDVEGYIIDVEKAEKQRKISDFKEFHKMKKVFLEENVWESIKDDIELLDDIAFILSAYRTDEDIEKEIKKKYPSLSADIVEVITKLPTSSKFVHLSALALRKITPFLEEGMRYDEACAEAGYNHSQLFIDGEKSKKLPVLKNDELYVSPVAFRALTQARKVLNAVIDKYGSPVYVNIELARDMSKSADERREEERKQAANLAAKDQAKDLFREELRKNGLPDVLDPTPLEVLKLRLYKQQNGKCVYSGEPLDLGRLSDYQIDHIIPYSRSFNDSFANKVLVLARENQHKKNRTPFEYFGHDKDRWAEFESLVLTINDHRKRRNLLIENFDEREQEMTEANLNDTRNICKKFAEEVRNKLKFAEYTRLNKKTGETSEVKIHVRTINGALTSMMRGVWGLSKNRDENDLHHAMDAAVVACINESDIQRMSRFYKQKESYEKFTEEEEIVDESTGEIISLIRADGKRKQFLAPWDNFRSELLAKIYTPYGEEGHITISRMPQRGVTGALHKDTIRSARIYDETGLVISRKPLSDLKLDQFKVLDNLQDYDEQQTGLVDPKNNVKLYTALKSRLLEFNGDAKKAFATPIHKPRIDGTAGPMVKTIKIAEKSSGILLNRGFAENGSMVRVDVFRKDSKYYAVPVYTSDTELPMKAIAINKPEKDWTRIDETFEFLHTFYPYDLIKIIDKKGEEIFGYYRSTHRGVATFNISNTNDNDLMTVVSYSGAKSIEKYDIDVLGNYYKVKGEKRRELEKRSNKK